MIARGLDSTDYDTFQIIMKRVRAPLRRHRRRGLLTSAMSADGSLVWQVAPLDAPCRITDSRKVTLVKGDIYIVDGVDPKLYKKHPCSGCGDACRGDGIQLVSPRLPDHLRWCSSSFRLVYRPNAMALYTTFGLGVQRRKTKGRARLI
jgi:hypothetical protein